MRTPSRRVSAGPAPARRPSPPLTLPVALLIGLLAAPAARAQTAVQLDGTNDHVTMGQAAALGAPTFTLELWFQRLGTGVTTSTGTGGVTAVPLLTKGRGEADGDNRDMNYFLGIRSSDNVLVADFEEGAGQTQPGLNHPAAGTAPAGLYFLRFEAGGRSFVRRFALTP